MSYAYCRRCNLCWPTSSCPAGKVLPPFMLSGLHVLPHFMDQEEEEFVVSKIDSFPWVASQSGRRKQDFGPRVNFRKKKLKYDNFHGFPRFAREISEKLKNVDVLDGFDPVELCHLEYNPERGSSIDPHLDDSWLWGERLVTINLLSRTTLILSPAKLNSLEICRCHDISDFSSFLTESNRNLLRQMNPNSLDTILENAEDRDLMDSRHWTICGHHSLAYTTLFHSLPPPEERTNKCDGDLSQVEVHVDLPPRSLFVMWSCARYHWYHQIKRTDITSRRLAMTYRELSNEFMEGGNQSLLGKKILDLAQQIID